MKQNTNNSIQIGDMVTLSVEGNETKYLVTEIKDYRIILKEYKTGEKSEMPNWTINVVEPEQ